MKLVFILATFVLLGCRVDVPEDDTRLASEGEAKEWFNSYGEKVPCDMSRKTCYETDNDKTFIDQCVADGFQAKTCGCYVLCSGSTSYKKDRPVAKGQGDDSGSGCAAADVNYMKKVKISLSKVFDLSECIDGHVCGGHRVRCTESNAEVSANIRSLGRGSCKEEVEKIFCGSEDLASLQCPEPTVDTLTREWVAAFKNDDKALRNCLQQSVCSDRKNSCPETLADRANAVRKGIAQKGCEYWFENFCRLGDTDL